MMRIDHDPIRLNGINWLDAKRGSIFSERHNNRTLVGNAKDQCAAVDMPAFFAEGALGRDFRFAKAPLACKFARGEFVIFSASVWRFVVVIKCQSAPTKFSDLIDPGSALGIRIHLSEPGRQNSRL